MHRRSQGAQRVHLHPQPRRLFYVKVKRTKCTRSSAIAETPARRAMSVEVSYSCTNNANRSCVSLRSTFSNCHVLVLYLHSFVHESFNYGTATMQCRGCRKHTPVYHQRCWCQLVRSCYHQIQLPPVLSMTPGTTQPAHRHRRGPPRWMDTNVRRQGVRVANSMKWPWRSFSRSLVIETFDRPHMISY